MHIWSAHAKQTDTIKISMSQTQTFVHYGNKITSVFIFTESQVCYNPNFKCELWGDLVMLSCWWNCICLTLTVKDFSSCREGETGDTPPPHTYTHSHMALACYGEGCRTRNQVRFHKSTLSVSCLDLPCVANPRKLYPPLSRHDAHQGSGSQGAQWLTGKLGWSSFICTI